MNLITNIKQTTANCINSLFGITITPEQVLVNATKPEFEGDYTIVLLPLSNNWVNHQMY